MRYMFGLREVEQSSLAESISSLFEDFDTVYEKVMDSLTAVLTRLLDRADYDDFDRAAVQLTARMIACTRAAHESCRFGHLVSGIAMARDLLETYVICHQLAEDQGLASEWIDATTIRERRKFGFSQALKSFDEETRLSLQDIYNLFSSDVHANHLTVSYVRFRNPIGINFYLSGCNSPNFLAAIASHCCQFSFSQLENLCNWYHEVPAVLAVCPSDFAKFQEDLNFAIHTLRDRAEIAEEQLSTSEKALNLSQEEIKLAEWLWQQSQSPKAEAK